MLLARGDTDVLEGHYGCYSIVVAEATCHSRSDCKVSASRQHLRYPILNLL